MSENRPSPEELKAKVIQEFKAADTDGTGITQDQLREVLTKAYGPEYLAGADAERRLEQTFSTLDRDKNKKLDYNEFVKAFEV
ncbi:EF-hand domain-containing protein [Streptomyces sp. NPDC006656]|uniref:EF-hand domain-containing protein n=1 Tax=Streptomyces sp. NPDC006656 TaxID=3156899 RepID=UPI003452B2E5